MPFSDITLRPWIAGQIRRWCGTVTSVVDVGAGAGTGADFYKPQIPGSRWTAIEIWEPYVKEYRLWDKYSAVVVADVRDLDPLPPADLYLFGDVLEHMEADEAVKVWDRAREVARWLVINLPVLPCEQGTVNGNPFEAHLVHWDMASVRESFTGIVAESPPRPDLPPWFGNTVVGAFIASGVSG